jgi:NAD(P)-dependent dehydrogenase (short-subunit alcohol dehydrogenase family)
MELNGSCRRRHRSRIGYRGGASPWRPIAAGARHVVVADLHAARPSGSPRRSVAPPVGIDVRDEAAIVRLVEDTRGGARTDRPVRVERRLRHRRGLEDSNDAIQRMWEVHCMAHIYAARAVLPSMIARGEGYLLNTASAAGLLTQIGSMAYSITKAAAMSLGEWLAVTHHHQGIRVSVLCPQAVATNIVRNSPRLRRARGGRPGLEGGVASGDGVLDRGRRRAVLHRRDPRGAVSWCCPHPEVATYVAAQGDRSRPLARRHAPLPDGPAPRRRPPRRRHRPLTVSTGSDPS